MSNFYLFVWTQRLNTDRLYHDDVLYSIMFSCLCWKQKSIRHAKRKRNFFKSPAVTRWQYCSTVTLGRGTPVSNCGHKISGQHTRRQQARPGHDSNFSTCTWTSGFRPVIASIARMFYNTRTTRIIKLITTTRVTLFCSVQNRRNYVLVSCREDPP